MNSLNSWREIYLVKDGKTCFNLKVNFYFSISVSHTFSFNITAMRGKSYMVWCLSCLCGTTNAKE